VSQMKGWEVAEFLTALRAVLGLDPIDGHKIGQRELGELDRFTTHFLSRTIGDGNRRVTPKRAAK